MGVRIHSMAAHCDGEAGLDRQHASEEEGVAPLRIRACASHAPHARERDDVRACRWAWRVVEREPENDEVLNHAEVCACTCAEHEKRARTQLRGGSGIFAFNVGVPWTFPLDTRSEPARLPRS